MCTRARPYGRAGRCGFGGWGVTVLTVSLTKGPLRVCVGLVKGFIRVHWRGFRVMTQVDLGLTGV
jgi:hypothetical protein